MKAGRALAVAALLALVVILGAGLVADVGRLQAAALVYPWWRFVAACGLVLGNYALRTVRFRYYLRALNISVSLGEAALVFVAGFLFTVTPGKMGEVVKGWLLHQRRGASVADVATAVIAERFTDVVGLLAIAAAGVAHYGAHQGLFWSVVALCVAFLTAVLHPRAVPQVLALVRKRWLVPSTAPASPAAPGQAARVLDPIARSSALPQASSTAEPRVELGSGVPDHLPSRAALALDGVVRIHAVLRDLCRPGRLLIGVGLAATAWLLEAMAFRLLLDGLGAGAGLGAAVVIYAMATLFGAVSMLPGGVGSTEAVMVALCLAPGLGLGLDLPQATFATLLIRFATLWFGVMLGAACFVPAQRRVQAGRERK